MVLEQADCPVLVVYGRNVPWPPTEVVVCYDRSSAAALALEMAAGLAAALRLPLRILEVIHSLSDEEAATAREAAVMAAQETLARSRGRLMRLRKKQLAARQGLLAAHVAALLAGRAIVVTAEVLVGHPVSTLHRAIGDKPHALVVLGTRGTSALSGTRIGSVATHLLRTTEGALVIAGHRAVKRRLQSGTARETSETRQR